MENCLIPKFKLDITGNEIHLWCGYPKCNYSIKFCVN